MARYNYEEEEVRNYKTMLYEKLEKFGMTMQEYQTFLLQGIKKEIIILRKLKERETNKVDIREE